MFKKLIVLLALLAVLAACTAEEPAEPAQLPPAESTSESAVNPIEEPVEEPVAGEETNGDVTVVAPSGSVDLGQLTPEAGTEGDGGLIEQPVPGMPDPQTRMIQLAGEALAERLGIDIGEIHLVTAEAKDWPDAGLGCPSPDLLYAAVITPGYQITFEVQGETYIYHTDSADTLVLCVDGQPADG